MKSDRASDIDYFAISICESQFLAEVMNTVAARQKQYQHFFQQSQGETCLQSHKSELKESWNAKTQEKLVDRKFPEGFITTPGILIRLLDKVTMTM